MVVNILLNDKQELYEKLLSDLKKLGISKNFNLILKDYSKRLLGRYNPNNKNLTLYVYPYKKGLYMYPYKELYETFIHEVVHSIQHNNPSFIRVKGVMHNKEFYKIYDDLIQKSYDLGILKGG